jgi:sugar/nucleoside kinase (ribokinase family)
MKEKFVLVLGDVNVDLVIPLRESTSDKTQPRTDTPELHGGGTGGNSAVAISRLNVPVGFIGTVGDDGYGRWSVNNLKAEGVDTSYLQLDDQAFTSIVMAVIRPDGERSLFVWPESGGAHTKLSPDAIRADMFQSVSWLHTTGLCLREEPVRTAQIKAMRLAREAGVTVSLDMNLRLETWGWDQSLRETFEKAISFADIIFGSGADEILPYTGEDSIPNAAKKLSASKRTVIARLGSDGALVVGPGEVFNYPAFQVEVVDTLGAGDAFNGGFICASLEGQNLLESVCWGNAVAGMKISKKGARALPSRKDLIQFLDQNRTRSTNL